MGEYARVLEISDGHFFLIGWVGENIFSVLTADHCYFSALEIIGINIIVIVEEHACIV